jgi:CRISPR-associated protein Cas5h
MTEQVIVFELNGRFAHFKVPETTRGAMSFPFPPRTTVLGLLAGILGYERNSYWKKDNPLRMAKIAIEVIHPVRTYPLKVNYVQTKYPLRIGKATILIPTDPLGPTSRGFTTQFRLDLLSNPKYRVYAAIDDEDVFTALKTSLEDHCYKYPPYLGHANLLAELELIGIFPYEEVRPGKYNVTGLIPLSVVNIDSESFVAGDFHIVHGVPMSMRIREEQEGIDGRYLAITELERMESLAFQVEGIQAPVVLEVGTKGPVVQVQLKDETRNIVFLPGAL